MLEETSVQIIFSSRSFANAILVTVTIHEAPNEWTGFVFILSYAYSRDCQAEVSVERKDHVGFLWHEKGPREKEKDQGEEKEPDYLQVLSP